jgi:hypothetical protein
LSFEQVKYTALDARLGSRLLGGTRSYMATIAMLIVSTLRWMSRWCGVVCEASIVILLWIFSVLYWIFYCYSNVTECFECSSMFGKIYLSTVDTIHNMIHDTWHDTRLHDTIDDTNG